VDFLTPRPVWLAGCVLVGACAGPPVLPAAPAPAPVASEAAPTSEPAAPKPAVPETFAPRIVPPSPPQAGNAVPDDMRPPGWHCHFIAPGKKYCHGGID